MAKPLGTFAPPGLVIALTVRGGKVNANAVRANRTKYVRAEALAFTMSSRSDLVKASKKPVGDTVLRVRLRPSVLS